MTIAVLAIGAGMTSNVFASTDKADKTTDTDNIQSGDQSGPDSTNGSVGTSAIETNSTTADTDQVQKGGQSGEQTGVDTGSQTDAETSN